MAWETLVLRVTGELITASTYNKTNYYNLEYIKEKLDSMVGCRLYKSSGGGSQTISNETATAVTFDSESFDTGGMHSTVSNTSRIVIPYTGYYVVFSRVVWLDVIDGDLGASRIRKNGSTQLAMSEEEGTGVDYFPNKLIDVFYLAAADYIELMVYQDRGTDNYVYAGEDTTCFGAYLLGT